MDIKNALDDDLATVNRLLRQTDTGEFFPCSRTTLKLSNMVANTTTELRLSRGQIDKAFSILRRHSSIPFDFPRMSSVPPTPECRKSLNERLDNGLVESKSFHDIPRYVVHEDINRMTRLVSPEQSSDSLSTLETSLSSSRFDSNPSMETVGTSPSALPGATSESPLESRGESDVDAEEGIVVDIVPYVAREWRGATDKARLIRRVSRQGQLQLQLICNKYFTHTCRL